MDALSRVRLEAGERVLAHSRANPSDDPNHHALVVRLEQLVKECVALDEKAIRGELAVHFTVRGKEELKELVHERLKALAGVAQLASIEEIGAMELVRVPRVKVAYKKFLATTRVMIGHATEYSALLEKYGLPAGFSADLTALADELEAATGRKEAGRQSHVGANADILDVLGEAMKVVKALDRLNRLRYRKDPERLAAWNSARDVVWPAARPDGPAPAEPAA